MKSSIFILLCIVVINAFTSGNFRVPSRPYVMYPIPPYTQSLCNPFADTVMVIGSATGSFDTLYRGVGGVARIIWSINLANVRYSIVADADYNQASGCCQTATTFKTPCTIYGIKYRTPQLAYIISWIDENKPVMTRSDSVSTYNQICYGSSVRSYPYYSASFQFERTTKVNSPGIFGDSVSVKIGVSYVDSIQYIGYDQYSFWGEFHDTVVLWLYYEIQYNTTGTEPIIAVSTERPERVMVYDIKGRRIGNAVLRDGGVIWSAQRPGVYVAKRASGKSFKFVRL